MSRFYPQDVRFKNFIIRATHPAWADPSYLQVTIVENGRVDFRFTKNIENATKAWGIHSQSLVILVRKVWPGWKIEKIQV